MLIPRRKPYFKNNLVKDSLVYAFKTHKHNNLIRGLERNLESKLKIPNPFVVSSGRVGFGLILQSLNLKRGCEIIVPALTFGPMLKVIEYAGYKPVVVDVDQNTFQISLNNIKKATTPKTSVILATHIFGHACDIEKIVNYAKRKNIYVIEDCAESLGTKVGGKLTGTFGDVALSSFNIAKSLQGIGGGLVFGKNKKIISKIRSKTTNAGKLNFKEVVRSIGGYYISQTFIWPLINFMTSFKGIQKKFVKLYRSSENYNFKPAGMPQFYAYLVSKNIDSFTKRMSQKRKIEQIYKKKLSKFVKFQNTQFLEKGNGYMVVGTINKDTIKLRRFLSIHGVDIAIKDEVIDLCNGNNLPISRKIHKHLISLPLYENMRSKEVERVCNLVTNYLSHNKNVNNTLK